MGDAIPVPEESAHLHILQRILRFGWGAGESDGLLGNLANMSVSIAPSPSADAVSAQSRIYARLRGRTHDLVHDAFEVEHAGLLVTLGDLERRLVENLELAHETFVWPMSTVLQ